MYAYVFVFNTNTFCVYRWMLNEWHTSLEDQNDTRKKKKRRSTFLTLKINEEEKLNSDYKSLNVIVILTSLLFIIFKKKCFIHPFFSFYSHSIQFSRFLDTINTRYYIRIRLSVVQMEIQSQNSDTYTNGTLCTYMNNVI